MRIKCKEVAAANGDVAMVRLDIEEIEPKAYRYNASAGGMENAPLASFLAMGWNARTYWSLLEPSRFYVPECHRLATA